MTDKHHIGRIVHFYTQAYTRDTAYYAGPFAALVVGVRETGLDLDVHMNEQTLQIAVLL